MFCDLLLNTERGPDLTFSGEKSMPILAVLWAGLMGVLRTDALVEMG